MVPPQAFWDAETPPEFNNPTWVAIEGSAEVTETSVTATFQIVEFIEPTNPEDPPFGDPVGTATLSATLTPDGEPIAYDDSGDQGNQKFGARASSSSTRSAGRSSCPRASPSTSRRVLASFDTFTQFANSPASSVFRWEEFNLSCGWLVGDSFIGLFAVVDEFGGFGDLFISTPETEVFGVEMFRESRRSPLRLKSCRCQYRAGAHPADSEPIGSARASATLTPTNQRINEFFSFGSEKIHVTGQLYSVDGTLSITSEIGDFTCP